MNQTHYEIDLEISEATKQKLLDYAKNNVDKYNDLGCMYSIEIKDENLIPEVLQKLAFKPIIRTILITKPGAAVPPHKDTYPNEYIRSSCVSWALSPNLVDFSPTLFYDDQNEVVYKHYYTNKGFILNTKLTHGMINNDHERFLFQLTYTKKPEVLAKTLLK
jgi:hypothetical protein